MNRPTDKQIEEVLAGVATPEDAKFVAEWFATEESLQTVSPVISVPFAFTVINPR